MNLFKQIKNKFKFYGITNVITNEDTFIDNKSNNKVKFNNIVLPDLAKSWLFNFEFKIADIGEIATDLSLRAKAVNIPSINCDCSYNENDNSYTINSENNKINIQFDEFQDFKGYEFWYKNFTKLQYFTIDICVYDSLLKNKIGTFTCFVDGINNISSLNFNMESKNKLGYTVTFIVDKIIFTK